MPKVDFLIVGQGICGTLLAESLLARGKKVMIIDDRPIHPSASLKAGGLLHTYTGKTYSVNPQYAQWLEVAITFYKELQENYATTMLHQKSLILFQHTTQLKNLNDAQLRDIRNHFIFNEAPGVIEPVYQIDVAKLLEIARQRFFDAGCLLEQTFDDALLQHLPNGVMYGDMKVSTIIFCEGTSAARSRYFQSLPFVMNRGDILWLSIPNLNTEMVYEQKLRLTHRYDDVWWCGSNHQWKYDNLLPDLFWEETAMQSLAKWIKLPFTLLSHEVAERPTSAGQFPLVGLHPQHPAVGIFNGMGTRGLSMAPFYAMHFADVLCGKMNAIPGYDHHKFSKYLV